METPPRLFSKGLVKLAASCLVGGAFQPREPSRFHNAREGERPREPVTT